ncbi:MAG: DUF2207 domain-containing protein [Dermatophilaceae bacterium]
MHPRSERAGRPRSERAGRSRYAVALALAVAVVLPWLTLGSAAAASARTPHSGVGAPPSGAPRAAAAPVGAWGASGIPRLRVPTADVIRVFDATYELDKDGGVAVTETITQVFDDALGVHHGIYRSITVRQGVQEQADAYRYYAMSEVSVSSPTGANTDLQQIDNGTEITLKIGNAKVTVSGTQTYVLRYRLAKVMNPQADQTAEFYYNVFTSDAMPKSRVSLAVTAPAAATEVRCGRGAEGTPCATATAGSPARFAVADLVPYEDLTVALRYPVAAFNPLRPDIRSGGSPLGEGQAVAASYAALAAGVLLPLAAIVGMTALVATRGRDEWYAGLTPGLSPGAAGSAGNGAPPVPRAPGIPPAPAPAAHPTRRGGTPTIAVQFTPPPGVQPGLVGTIVDESADTLDVSATVIDLAVRGFLQIEEVAPGGMFKRTDWQLTRLVPRPEESLRPYESTVLEGLFAQSNPVLLSDLKNHFAESLATAKHEMYAEVVQRGWFRSSPERQRAGWRLLGGVLAGGGAVMLFTLGSAMRGVDRTAGIGLPVSSGVILGAGTLVAGVVVFLLGGRMAAKTAAGSATLAQSLGFRQYLVTAEAGQIRWEEAQDIFSRYLPFAIVFGVAQRWAETFQKVAQAAAAAGQPLAMPTWYLYQGALFPDFGGIVSGVDDFSTSASGTFQSTPGSSGGSGFGSSGGSFSGGGIGGSSSGTW